MNKLRRRCLTALLVVSFLATGACAGAETQAAIPDPPRQMSSPGDGKSIAVLAGGCFWGIEGVFERIEGVSNVVSGYSGGDAATASYKLVGNGLTGHAESVYIEFDPGVVTFGTLLKVFFSVAHDPTQLNYQGPDHGTQYRSAIFYADDEQRRVSEEYIRTLSEAGVYQDPIVTEVAALTAFYPAEDYHQDFMRLNPDYPYIVYWDRPKIVALEKTFPDLLVERP